MRRQTPSGVRSSAFRNSFLSFAKTCSIGLRSGEYCGRKNRRAPLARMALLIAALMGAEIVHDDDVAMLQSRRKNLLDIGQKAFAVDRPVEHEGRRDFVASQGGEECHRFPMTLWRLGDERLAASVPAMCARHIGLRPCLVDEDKAPWIEAQLDFLPQGAAPQWY